MGGVCITGIRQGIPLCYAKALLWGAPLLYPFFIKIKERKEKMKKVLKLLTTVLVLISVIFGILSCTGLFPQTQPEPTPEDIWDSATYTTDTTLGSGAICIQVEVKIDDRSVTFTINTDAATLGDALLEHDLIAGEMGAYGLYIKKVNGIVADYDVDHTYWGIYKNGEYLMTGVDTTPIANGEHYELVREK